MVDMAPVTSAPQTDAARSRAGSGDAAGRRLAAGGREAGGGRRTDRADPAAGEAGGGGAARAEAAADAAKARARKGRARSRSRRRSSQRCPPEAKKPVDAPPAPRTTAPPRAERQAPRLPPSAPAPSAAAMASYKQLVAAHLQRFQQYPPAAKAAGQQGTAGQLYAQPQRQRDFRRPRRIIGRFGARRRDAGDGRARPRPFPPIPAEIPNGSISFNIPLRFDCRVR